LSLFDTDSRLPLAVHAAGAFAAAVAVWAGNNAVGPEIAFTLLYLGPIAWMAWNAGRPAGIAAAGGCAAAWLQAEIAHKPAAWASRPVIVWNLCVELGVFLVFAMLVSALRARLGYEARLARIDPLTGAANRRGFLEAAAREVRHSRGLTLVFADIDDFKGVNDRMGHDAGDALLATVARTLQVTLRTRDVVARMGGDEFAALLPGLPSDDADTLLRRTRERLGAAARRAGFDVTFSIGAVTCVDEVATVGQLLTLADRLMYEVKRGGKDGLVHRSSRDLLQTARPA